MEGIKQPWNLAFIMTVVHNTIVIWNSCEEQSDLKAKSIHWFQCTNCTYDAQSTRPRR